MKPGEKTAADWITRPLVMSFLDQSLSTIPGAGPGPWPGPPDITRCCRNRPAAPRPRRTPRRRSCRPAPGPARPWPSRARTPRARPFPRRLTTGAPLPRPACRSPPPAPAAPNESRSSLPYCVLPPLVARPAADAAPGQPGHELLGGLPRDALPGGTEPVPGGDLSQAHHRHAHQVGLGVVQAGVLPDHPAAHLAALALAAFQPVPDRALVAQVRLEHQPVRLPLALHVLEVGAERGGHPLLVVGGRAERVADGVHQFVHALVEQGQVQVELAGEVLVQDGFADAGPLGDLIHGGGVVPLRYEDLERRVQELPPPFVPGQPRAAWPCIRGCGQGSVSGGRPRPHAAFEPS